MSSANVDFSGCHVAISGMVPEGRQARFVSASRRQKPEHAPGLTVLKPGGIDLALNY
jgi:hypothetical protein